ncbi:nuclear transport factor 2 family protein [Adhaeribacter rhizoryzae]|uniref:Nuclear transport factor 2 family protein n=1 Tax=Adhaeribacter rhizoryzae TaxID=2607907 RepID=A0A5M6DP53_9BACT|nr:nuclear transport factor 2 family protein [Adhaeribacter rhizoryzae]KAA5549213.1 nuclear transport factor 2 family protein [Adhaeribacter rhizoryzae]
MNEQENVKVVQEGYRLFLTGEIENLMPHYTEDVEYIVPGPTDLSPIAGRYIGKDGVKQFYSKVGATFEFSVFEPLEMIAQGDKVVVLGHYQSKARATGQPLNIEWIHVFQLRDGKVSRFQIYEDTATVVAALNNANVGAV